MTLMFKRSMSLYSYYIPFLGKSLSITINLYDFIVVSDFKNDPFRN